MASFELSFAVLFVANNVTFQSRCQAQACADKAAGHRINAFLKLVYDSLSL